MDLTYALRADARATSAAVPLSAFAAIALSLIACLAVALLNGLPLILADTATYLVSGTTFTVPWDRPIFYGLFMRPLLFAHLWPVVVAQSTIAIAMLWLAVRVAKARIDPVRFGFLMITLAIFSTLPWITGELMPDIFAAIAVLGAYLMIFGEKELSARAALLVAAITAFSVSTHLSHVPLFAGTVLAAALWRWFLCGRDGVLRRVGLAAATFIIAVAAIVATNLVQYGSIGLSRGSGVFALAKVLESGAVDSYLAEACPEAGYALCEARNDLPRNVNELLWGEESTVRRMTDPRVLLDEAGTIAVNAMVAFPLPVIRHSAERSLEQLASISVANGPSPVAVSSFLEHVDLGAAFHDAALASRQAEGALPFALGDLLAIAGLLAAAFWLAFAAWTGIRSGTVTLLVTVLSGVVVNAVVCGGLSIVDGRYQARVVWLITFVGLLAAHEAWDMRRRRTL